VNTRVTIQTRTFILLLIVLVVSLFGGCSKNDPDPLVNVPDDDVEMNTAIAKARASLPEFWQHFERPRTGETSFSLKVKISEGKETEHFWTDHIEQKDGKVFGIIGNDAESVHNVKLGDRVEILEPNISDWMYLRNDKIVGNYTMRPLFKHMSAKDVEKYKGMLANPDADH